ncbi:MAG: hypothetical protein IPJ81_08315 [Chitinophagaceae bacterium]|nr:hypothetical protein [Chitinophagaceae bacterium]
MLYNKIIDRQIDPFAYIQQVYKNEINFLNAAIAKIRLAQNAIQQYPGCL